MPKTPTPPPTGSYWSSGTLGALIDHGYRIAIYCENPREAGVTCGFVKWADLEKLARRLGRDHSSLAPDITPHMWCTKCGGRKVSIRCHPPAPGIGQSHYHG